MNDPLQNLNFIDLICDRHMQLRTKIETLWNDSSDIYISNSEWFIMSRIYKQQPTISHIAKNVDISRQATHKFIKSLEQKGLLQINNLENNKKVKCVQLTQRGEECFELYLSLKKNLEKKIIEKIGIKKLNILKEIMIADWGI